MVVYCTQHRSHTRACRVRFPTGAPFLSREVDVKITERVIRGMEQILAGYGPGGELQGADAITLLGLATYDDQGHLNQEGIQALAYVSQLYQDRQSVLFSVMLQGFISSLPNDPNIYVPDGGAPARPQPATQKPSSKPPSQPARTQPGPAAAPAANHDPRLIGAWEYSAYYSVSGYSSSHSEVRVLRADGHFVESSDSYINATTRDSCGDETSRSSFSNTPQDQRGTWETGGNRLRLVWDNNMYAIYEFEVGRDGMLLTPTGPGGGKPTYWARMR